MDAMLLRLLLVVCGGPLACLVAVAGVLYGAWRMSRRDDGWDR
jgi:hypothetical protein